MDSLERARKVHNFDLWAWVIMPEHFHLLLFPRPGGPPMGSILLSIKQSTTRRALLWTKTNRPDALHVFEDRQPSGSISHRF